MSDHVNEVELRWVRRAVWWMPLVLALAAPLLYRGTWALLVLDASLVKPLSAAAWAGTSLLGAGFGLALMLGWRRMLTSSAARRLSWRWSVGLALLLVVGAEAVVRRTPVLDAAWAALRSRAPHDGDFFIREMALFRRAALTNQRPPGYPRVLVAGSSQLIMGVDYELLQRLCPHQGVERRCIAAMSPARMLMAEPFLGVRTGDTVVVYWSEFDMGGLTQLDTSWFRPLANGAGLRALWQVLPRQTMLAGWRNVLDLACASGSELWRSRDAWRLVLTRVTGSLPGPKSEAGTGLVADQAGGYGSGLRNERFFQAGLEASRRLLRDWQQAGARVVVLEGSLNPAMHQPETPARRAQTRAWLAAACAETGARYLPLEQQGYQPAALDWSDGTHLNADGREKFTRYLAEVVVPPAPTP